MTVLLDNVLSGSDLERLARLAAEDDGFEDGRVSAGWAARAVKANEQLAGGPRLDAIRTQVRDALSRHGLFNAYARPKSVFRILLSRYRPGMEYGLHVDDAVMGGHRADLSFTLFLSQPDSYEGGALRLDTAEGETEVKLEPGQAVLYPTGALHQVLPVTKGERLAVVGWVQSLIRRGDQREILFDLDQTIAELRQSAPRPALDRLLKTKTNLLRQWAEV